MPTHHNPVKEERHIFISFFFFIRHIFISLFFFNQRRDTGTKQLQNGLKKQPLIFGIACDLWEEVNSVWLVNFKCTKT